MSALSDIARIPFTAPSDLADNPMRFLAVRQDDIARIVTLRTSGSTGEPKRLFFTKKDLELTVDFFHHGMSTLSTTRVNGSWFSFPVKVRTVWGICFFGAFREWMSIPLCTVLLPIPATPLKQSPLSVRIVW